MARKKNNLDKLLMRGSDVDLYVGQRLRKRRSDMGFTQKGLASHLNVTFQQIQKYEKGCNRISCSKLYEIAGILKTQVGYFFDGIESINNNKNAEIVSMAESEQTPYVSDADVVEHDIKSLMKNYRKIKSKEMRSLALDVVKRMAAQ